MNQESLQDIVIWVDAMDQLFNAPAIDPLSNKPAIIIGEAALPYAVRQAISQGARDWKGRRVVIRLPAEQIDPETQSKAAAVVRRYAAAKQEDNIARVRISRRRGVVALAVAIAIAVLVLVVLVILTNTLLSSASDAIKGLLAGIQSIGLCLNGWDLGWKTGYCAAWRRRKLSWNQNRPRLAVPSGR
jgi:hypothetical protein